MGLDFTLTKDFLKKAIQSLGKVKKVKRYPFRRIASLLKLSCGPLEAMLEHGGGMATQ